MSLLPPWQPLSQRGSGLFEEESLFEGVPLHLREPLEEWLQETLTEENARDIALRFRINLAGAALITGGALDRLVYWAMRDGDLMLDVIDATLRSELDDDQAWSLERTLELGGSAWRVAHDGRSLERRVDETVRAAVASAASPGTSAAAHLAAAWQAAYGRDPNPSRSYSEAIKAVEAAAVAVVAPANNRATLGTVIRDLESTRQRWRLSIARVDDTGGIDSLLAMLRLLWHGQSDRHGAPNRTVQVTAEAAAGAVHLAATLVQWFQGDLVMRASS